MTFRCWGLPFPRLQLMAFIYIWRIQFTLGGQINETVDDTDPSIRYEPSSSWRASSTICSTCLNPDTSNAYLGTYHDGTHLITGDIVDDEPAEPSSGKGGGGGDGSGKGGGKGGPNRRRRRNATPLLYRRVDLAVADIDMTAEFQFTGTAAYLYCIQPLGVSLVDTAPTAMNLTFVLDNTTTGTFLRQGSDKSSTYLPGVNVFSATHLTDTPHTLRVNVGPNSVFLVDYFVFTRTTAQNIANGTPSASVASASKPTESVSASAKRHNIATFAGAIGGSVGVLALLALGLAFSIIKRRRNYERRERLESAANEGGLLRAVGSNGSSTVVYGPRPFVPRYFPGTHIPSDPPPYVESISGPPSDASHISTPMRSIAVLPVSYAAHMALNGQDRSYADIPPTTPPPPLDDLLPPPPPFGVAIASQASELPPGLTAVAVDRQESDILATEALFLAPPAETNITQHHGAVPPP